MKPHTFESLAPKTGSNTEGYGTNGQVIDLSGNLNDPIWAPNYTTDYTNVSEANQARHAYYKKYRILKDFLIASGVDHELVLEKYDRTKDFITKSFERFYGETSDEDEAADFAFIVPTRITSWSGEYAQEINDYLPLLEHVDPLTRVRALQGMVPTVLDQYEQSSSCKRGSVIFAPALLQMGLDLGMKDGIRAGRKATADAAFLASERLGAKVIGLGATLPGVTRMGTTISQEGLTVTTGHGATVAMFSNIPLCLVENQMTSFNTIGVVGMGSIGSSSADYMLSQNPEVQLVVYDEDAEKSKKAVSRLAETYGRNRVRAAPTMEAILSDDRVEVVASAITGQLTNEQASLLSGKYFVDDSQPGAITKEMIDRYNLTCMWPIVTSPLLHKKGKGIGGGDGPASPKYEDFTCAGEVAAIANSDRYDLAVNKPVDPNTARELGAVLSQMGIVHASPQSWGRYVDLTQK